MARLSTLVVSLQAESAELKKGLAEANRKLDSFAAHAKRAADTVGQAFALDMLAQGATALYGFLKAGADAADGLNDLSQAVGVPVESLSALAYAAQMSGSSTEELGQGLGRLSKQMAEAHGGSAQQAAVFTALGVSITDAAGNLRSTDEVFKDIAQRFSEVEDGAAKTALAQEVFGKSGAALIPLLDEGREGLARAAEEAARFGFVVTKEGAAGAARFNDSLDNLKTMATGLATQVVANLAPSLAGLNEELLDGATYGGAFKEAVDGISAVLRLLATGGVVAAEVLHTLGAGLAGVASTVVNLVQGKFREAGEAFTEGLGREVYEGWTGAARRIEAIWKTEGPGQALQKDAQQGKAGADALLRAFEAAQRAAEARKKTADEARRAAEAADAALLSYARTQLDLDRKLQGIDGQVARRRDAATSGGQPATGGFADMDAALTALADALKAEATERARAAELDRDGHVMEAYRAELAADAHKVLAERAEGAADAFATLERQAVDAAEQVGAMAVESGAAAAEAGRQRSLDEAAVPGQLGSMLAPAGPAMGAALQGAQTGMAAGPMGAVAGAAVGLLSQSEQFQSAMATLEEVFQTLADSVGSLMEPLLPLLDIAAQLGSFFGQLLSVITPLVELIAKPLYGVFRGFALAIMGIVRAVAKIINGITGIFGKKAFDTDAMDKSMRELQRSSIDTAHAQDKVTKSAEAVAESLGNAARGFKVSLARFNAIDEESRQPPAEPVTNVSVELDGKEIARTIAIERKRERINRGGIGQERAPRYGGSP